MNTVPTYKILLACALVLTTATIKGEESARQAGSGAGVAAAGGGLAERKAKTQGYLRQTFVAGMINARELIEIKKALGTPDAAKLDELLDMLETLADAQQLMVEAFKAWWAAERGEFGNAPAPVVKTTPPATDHRGASPAPVGPVEPVTKQHAKSSTGMTAFQWAGKKWESLPQASLTNLVSITGKQTKGQLIPAEFVITYDVGRMSTTRGGMGDPARDMGKTIGGIFGGNLTSAVLPAEKLKVDSDRALEIVLERLPSGATVSSTEIKLERGGPSGPYWEFRVWAKRLRQPRDEIPLGIIRVLTDDGTVIHNELRPKHYD